MFCCLEFFGVLLDLGFGLVDLGLDCLVGSHLLFVICDGFGVVVLVLLLE